MKYVMALDQGTTSSRCILFDKNGKVVSSAQKEFKQIYPKAGWVEHDAMEIWSSQISVAQEALLKIGAEGSDVAAIGITNQRETTIVWDKETGMPICNAIVWQCRRTAEYCDKLKDDGLTDFFRNKTGLIIDAYFSATKIKWILDNVPNARQKANEGKLLFGTVETWLIWRLTKGKIHITDFSNASRTMLFNIHTLKWDDEILELFNIPKSMLPEVKPSSSRYGFTDSVFFGTPILIGGAAGDQQSALFGQCCFDKGDVKNTYGTGGFMLMNTGDKPIESKNGLLTTIAWGLDNKVTYALEGSVFIAGAVVQWLRDELKLVSSSSETEAAAEKVSDSGGVYVVPAFTGLGAPYWDPYARGTIIGITRGTNKYQIIRASLEAIAYQIYDVLKTMQNDSHFEIKNLKVDGGASANNFLLKFQSDITNQKIIRPSCTETTALGAAFLAGLASGYWKSVDEIEHLNLYDQVFTPSMDDSEREKLISGWHKAVSRCRDWEDHE